MRMSKLFFRTLREVPADAKVVSHQLMLRAGMIRKVASGIYNFLPLGLRVVEKISTIVEEEMVRASGQKILMPIVQPAELWRESGRFDQYGPELLRFKDRKDTWFCLGPTHEEVITALVRDDLTSYKDLPLILFQIQTKFRDEIRPRFGLMRGREFLMKDAYSFCVDKKTQDEVYKSMWDAYHKIFQRCGLDFRAVRAATGSIGGDLSHEFQVLAKSGEDAIASCSACGYAANVELAQIMHEPMPPDVEAKGTFAKVSTPGQKSIEEVSSFLNRDANDFIKTLAFEADDRICLALVRGDQELSEAKLKSAIGADKLVVAEETKVNKEIGPVGFIGPIGIQQGVRVVADWSLFNKKDLVAGANEADFHLSSVDVMRDINPQFFDLRKAHEKDPCGQCGKPFSLLRGIEVGHIFYLGQKYSKALKAFVQNEHGESVYLEMGCYGIGIGRTAAAAIEQNHDERGIIWPASIAPYHVHVVQLGKGQEIADVALNVYETLMAAGIEVLLDDRDERAGVKLNDADLIGCPLRITLGTKGIKNGEMEIVPRHAQAAGPIKVLIKSDYTKKIKELLFS